MSYKEYENKKKVLIEIAVVIAVTSALCVFSYFTGPKEASGSNPDPIAVELKSIADHAKDYIKENSYSKSSIRIIRNTIYDREDDMKDIWVKYSGVNAFGVWVVCTTLFTVHPDSGVVGVIEYAPFYEKVANFDEPGEN